MIRNDDELAVVRQQLDRVESALQALARDVRPQSEARYRLMAEGYEDQIRALREQVEAYQRPAAVRPISPRGGGTIAAG